ncbi:LpsS [Acetobacter orientalis]|uniref:LpsS n=1 Tax=Acetobacter orientalis TaxID=146474 RepID=A0A2Z5ZEQ1_9PROT|nr:LpsS [Acetobacter orientalis]
MLIFCVIVLIAMMQPSSGWKESLPCAQCQRIRLKIKEAARGFCR